MKTDVDTVMIVPHNQILPRSSKRRSRWKHENIRIFWIRFRNFNKIQNVLPPTEPFGCSPSLPTVNLTTSLVLNTEANTNKNFNGTRREDRAIFW